MIVSGEEEGRKCKINISCAFISPHHSPTRLNALGQQSGKKEKSMEDQIHGLKQKSDMRIEQTT
jgi:hypothetical protein